MNQELRKRAGENLRFMRTSRRMTALDLAIKLNEEFGETITESAILKYEKGERPMSQERVVQFAFCLNCSVASLMDGLDLNQERRQEKKELRQLPRSVHAIFHWVATSWKGNIAVLATAFGLYAATPHKYRRHAMMELLSQIDKAVKKGDLRQDDIPECIRIGIPALERSLGNLYDKEENQ